MNMNAENEIKFSVVVPLHNEERNVPPLHRRLTEVMGRLEEPYELIFVDDGSKDRTPNVLCDIAARDPHVRVITLGRNFGQTAALKAGFDAALGEIIVSLDGDLQDEPGEIPRLIAKLEEGYDLVSGWRVKRNETWLTRRLPSRIANCAIARVSHVPLHDFGTTFKVYRREVIQNIQLYGELHRFIPALAAWSGARITEVPIKQFPRQNGKSHYGLSRTLRVLLDLLSTKFLLDYSTRPLHFFGLIGLASSGAGVLLGLALVARKVIFHIDIMGPAMFVAILLILAGIQLLSLGLVSEILARTYYESQGKPIYSTRQPRYKNVVPILAPQYRMRRTAMDRQARDHVRSGA
jgi:glycosyltransferase involved in cell wall biosynthesis